MRRGSVTVNPNQQPKQGRNGPIKDSQISMKSSDSVSWESGMPSLFQIAAFFEDFFPAKGKEPTESLRQLPFAEYMLNPEKVMALLRPDTRTEAVIAAPVKSRAPGKRAARAVSKKSGGANLGDLNDRGVSLPEPPKRVEFQLHAPAATAVKLAGDFTEWELRAIEMMHSADGVWFTVVPLAPGSYSYRFIVDGEWRDDPRTERRVPNPFGTQNAIIHVK